MTATEAEARDDELPTEELVPIEELVLLLSAPERQDAAEIRDPIAVFAARPPDPAPCGIPG